jgi:hypothetical protein
MTRLYTIKDLPQSKAEELDSNFDVGGKGLTEGAGAVYNNQAGQTVVDFDSAAFGTFKEKYVARFSPLKGNAAFASQTLGKTYLDLLAAVESNSIPPDHVVTQSQDRPASEPTDTAPSEPQPDGAPQFSVTSAPRILLGDDPAMAMPAIKKEWVEAYYAIRYRSGDPDFDGVRFYNELAALATPENDYAISRDALESLRSAHPGAIAKIFSHFQSETSYSEHAISSEFDSFTIRIFIDKKTEQNTVEFIGTDGTSIRQFYTHQGHLTDVDTGDALSTDERMLWRVDDALATALLYGIGANVLAPNDAEAAEILADQLPRPPE